MSHKWTYEGIEYLYFVDAPGGPLVNNDPAVKSEGPLLKEGLMHKYKCDICDARCVNSEDQPVKIPVPCTYDIN